MTDGGWLGLLSLCTIRFDVRLSSSSSHRGSNNEWDTYYVYVLVLNYENRQCRTSTDEMVILVEKDYVYNSESRLACKSCALEQKNKPV